MELHKDPTLGIDKDHVDIAKDNEKGKEDAYADLAMNEEMMENDDLLDEISEEVQAFEKELEDERIEAISQLSPSRKDRLSLTKLKEPSEVQGGEVVARGTSNKPALGKIDTTIAQTIGKRRGSRSPDLKGAAASKKLATRGRLSPKAKLLKPSREPSASARNSLKFPRHEVYPSASKGRKPVSNSGSVVSQKPSSSRI